MDTEANRPSLRLVWKADDVPSTAKDRKGIVSDNEWEADMFEGSAQRVCETLRSGNFDIEQFQNNLALHLEQCMRLQIMYGNKTEDQEI